MLGQALNVLIAAKDTYTTAVTGGTISASIGFSGVTLVNQTFDLCTTLSSAPFPGVPTCPVPPMNLKSTSFSFVIPNVLPPGVYNGTISVVDQNNRVIQCVQINLALTGGSKAVLGKRKINF